MAGVLPPRIGTSMAEVKVLCPRCRKPNPRNDQTLRRARFCQHCGHDIVLNNEGTHDGPRFYITRVIKEGGQGAVYETIGEDWQTYAVKELLDRFNDQRERVEATERFRSEADLLQSLRHPRIPRVYAHFEDEGRHYLAIDYIDGEDLEQMIEREGPLSEQLVLEWADQICDVLEYLHSRGLIYRDMKPSNLMIDRRNGGIKLIDFGIAKVFQRTDRGTQIGTPGYAPPEQYQGLSSAETDIYGLGATLHHVLSGRDPRDEPPFSFPPIRTLRPQLSRRTADAITKALQMKPEDRFRSAAAFRTALRPEPVAAPREVRRAPATGNLPQAVAARPAAVQPAPTPPAAPALPKPTAPVVPARPARSARQPRRGPLATLARTLVLALLITLLLGMGLFFGRPDLVQQYAPALLPRAVPTQSALPAQHVASFDLELRAPSNADPAVLSSGFPEESAGALH